MSLQRLQMPGRRGLTIAAGFRDLLFPPICFACGAVPVVARGSLGGFFCAACLAKIRLAGPDACPTCGETRRNENRLSCRRCADLVRHCRKNDAVPERTGGHSGFAFHRCAAGAEYSGPIRDLVHRLKFSREERASIPLGRLAAMAASKALGGATAHLVTPVPLHPLKRIMRGYNQAALIARVAARELGVPFRDGIVRRTRFTPPQGSLDGKRRRDNVSGAFRHTRKAGRFSRLHLVLVDDVISTASTIDLCAAALRSAGIEAVYGAAAAT